MQKKKPNFIFIFVDDLGWGDLGCYGNPIVKTPNLDKMAFNGTRFTQSYVNASMCSPSRAAVITGHFPSRHRIHFWMDRKHNAKVGMPDYLDPEVYTLPKLLQQSGYATAHFGKWHIGDGPDAPQVADYGFDETRIICQGNGPGYGVPANHHRGTEMIVDSAIDFINRNKDKPFFVNVWPRDVHAALDPAVDALSRYNHLASEGKYKTAMQVYYAVITEMDRQIGRLLDYLDSEKLDEDTIVIFSSDNGPQEYFVANASHHNAGSTGPFRGRKRSLYEGGIRMPFILQWKNHTPANEIDNKSVISGIDLLPTFCHLANVPLPGDYHPDGENIADCFLGRNFTRCKELYWEWRVERKLTPAPSAHVSPRIAIRDKNYKLLFNPDNSRVELYNIPEQPMELHSIAEKHPEIVESMKQKALEWVKTLPDMPIADTSGTAPIMWPLKIDPSELADPDFD